MSAAPQLLADRMLGKLARILRMTGQDTEYVREGEAFRIADRAVQVHGGEGIIQGNIVEWIFRMLRMYRITTGTSEIQRNTIAQALLDPGR